ncbi:MAG: response regulator [Thermoplasmatota archaeon]
MVRLLVVDDEPGFRLLAKLILEDRPEYQVVGEAGDGEQAIEHARRLQPDAVLLDLNMPVMGGLKALPRLRAASPASLVIVVSVARDQQELHQAKMAGAHGFIDKALPNEEFVRALDACLSSHGWSEHRRDSFGIVARQDR